MYDINSAAVHCAKSLMFCMAGILWIAGIVNSVASFYVTPMRVVITCVAKEKA